ncbi:hypothetical protein T484DRAFT_1621166, partial [Baffinella frigidus]
VYTHILVWTYLYTGVCMLIYWYVYVVVYNPRIYTGVYTRILVCTYLYTGVYMPIYWCVYMVVYV